MAERLTRGRAVSEAGLRMTLGNGFAHSSTVIVRASSQASSPSVAFKGFAHTGFVKSGSAHENIFLSQPAGEIVSGRRRTVSPLFIVEVAFTSASSASAAIKLHWGASASVPWFRVRARARFEVGARILHRLGKRQSWGRGMAGRGSGAGNRAHLQCFHGLVAEENGTRA